MPHLISINSGHLSISLSLRSPAPNKTFTTYTCPSQPPSAVPAIGQYSHSVTALSHLSTHSLKIILHTPINQQWINIATPLYLILQRERETPIQSQINNYSSMSWYVFNSFCLQNRLLSILLLPIPCLANITPCPGFGRLKVLFKFRLERDGHLNNNTTPLIMDYCHSGS